MRKVILVILSILVVLILLVLVISKIAHYRFNRMVQNEVGAFFSSVEDKHVVIQQSDLKDLPDPVQKWLQSSQVMGKEKIVAARTKQKINMRLKADQPWMNAQAEQYIRTEEPGFLWSVDLKMAPFLQIVGRDKYLDGQGNMLIKVLSLVNVANGSGKEIDQGSLLRYLVEIAWVPSAALSEYIQWEEFDSNSAKATMSYKGVTASGVFTFNDQGAVQSFVAQRYGDFDGKYRMETWLCEMKEYKEFGGVKIPSQGDITWKLKTGDFHWYHFNVEEMEFNKAESY